VASFLLDLATRLRGLDLDASKALADAPDEWLIGAGLSPRGARDAVRYTSHFRCSLGVRLERLLEPTDNAATTRRG
jgi:hypothetical protein